jgi:hypothetical protein
MNSKMVESLTSNKDKSVVQSAQDKEIHMLKQSLKEKDEIIFALKEQLCR